MARKYLGGSGERLTVWISIAASTVLIFYGYDQGVFGNVIINQNFLDTFGHPSANMQGVMTSIYSELAIKKPSRIVETNESQILAASSVPCLQYGREISSVGRNRL